MPFLLPCARHMPGHLSLERLPLVGRDEELGYLRSLLERAAGGAGSATVITGPGGIGKSRLAHAFLQEARLRGCTVASGRAYAAEQGVPFAPVSDAFAPLLRARPVERLPSLVSNIEQELAQLFPTSLPRTGSSARGVESPAQLLWALAELTRRLAAEAPVVVLIEDLQWADAASQELLHFLVRHTRDAGVAVVLTVNDSDAAAQSLLAALDLSLGRVGFVDALRLEPLTADETRELVRNAFRVDDSVAGEFSAELYRRTRGNPFFIDELLKSLVLSGALVRRGSSWVGWDALRFEPPRTVRDAVRLRCAALSQPALELAQLSAVFGTRIRYTVLRSLATMPEDVLAASLDELCQRAVLDEATLDDEPVYDFRHPLVREVLYDDVGLATRRLLHARIAEALEAGYGADADAHADQLARHFLHGGARREPRTVRYLHAAGSAALRCHAHRAAAEYLAAAVAATELQDPQRTALLEDLARARLRMGQREAALALLDEARTSARASSDDEAVARLWWRTGLAQYWRGAHAGALESLDAGCTAARPHGHVAVLARLQIARATCLQALGRSDEARAALEDAHARAQEADDPALQARAERALLQFHIWTGPPDRARAHGERALALARASGDAYLECTVHWALGVLHGLTGNAPECLRAIEASGRLAEELGSPFLRVTSLELLIEYCYGNGDWDTGLAVGERAITLARTLQLRALLPRVLVWTALIYLGRDELDTARAYIEEAARLARADEENAARDIHVLVPVAIGRTFLHLASGEYELAVDVGVRALALVDRTGYRAWAVHRLLPVIAEAYLQQHRVTECRPFAERLRTDSGVLKHELGLAWADACDGLMMWLDGDPAGGAVLLRAAAERLEAVPYVYDAARVRRQLAGRLFDAGDRDGAVHELRRVHDVLAGLGANRELEKARGQFREVSARPQPRTTAPGSGLLTERELEITRLVAARQSNKAIARKLGISPRTVGTHVSNIFRKLELQNRRELESYARTMLA